MEIFTFWVEILVQLGSGAFGIVLGLLLIYAKKDGFLETLKLLKLPIAAWLTFWTIGAFDIYFRHFS